MDFRRSLVASLLLIVGSVSAQSYTCPDQPNWDAVACSMHLAITAEDGGGFYVTPGLTRAVYREYTVTAGASTVTLHIYNHFLDSDRVARQVAKAWAAQPAVLRRSVMPLILSVDIGAGDAAVFWDMTDQSPQSYVIEYPAAYVHEYADTLDWSFEEMLTHEMCHVIDRKLGQLSDFADWQNAVIRDNGFVTDYARSSTREDFAESCAAHILLAIGDRLTAEHRGHVLRTMQYRSAYFDRLFSLRSGLN